MKKSLLLAGALATVMSASALTPEILTDMYCMQMSGNGRYIGSAIYGQLTVLDRETGKIYEHESESAYAGNGKAISDAGWMVGCYIDGTPAVFIDGEWTDLKLATGFYSAFPNAITPDNKFIAGYANTYDSPIMQLPVMWELNEDGTYGEPFKLPHPDVDPITGDIPQYIMAVAISDDGRKVFGQMVHGTGMFIFPMIFELNDNNEWTYSYPGIELFNPEHLELPEDPGDFDYPYPSYEDFMTPEELEAYQKAISDYYAAGDWSLDYPFFGDFMTPEEIEAYNEAADAYNEAAEAYNEKYYAYFDVLDEIRATSPQLVQNQVFCSPDGNTVVFNAEISDGFGWWAQSIACPLQVDLTTGEAFQWDSSLNLYCSGVLNDGTLLGHTDAKVMSGLPVMAYLKFPDNEEFVTLSDYLVAQDPGMESWIKINLTHPFIVDFDEDDNEITEDKVAFGIPTASNDLSTIITTSVTQFWQVPEDVKDELDWYYTYVFSGLTNGVGNVAVDNAELTIKSLGNGVLSVSAPATIELFNLSGACVAKTATNGGTVNTGVESGIYVVKATAKNGTSTVAKLAF